jgi:hypothetical protein
MGCPCFRWGSLRGHPSFRLEDSVSTTKRELRDAIRDKQGRVVAQLVVRVMRESVEARRGNG